MSTPSAGASLPAASRGVTDIADRVVERIAGRAAGRVTNVLPPPPSGVTRLVGGGTERVARAHLDGDSVRLAVRCCVVYPAPIRTVARQVQAEVRSTVEQLTGLDVTSVQVEVVAAPVHPPEAQRVR
jgi:uncharacterized alkaline shock family protein YloU